ncbi:GPO family capsid scaffolding protein [Pseudomonas huanghezhanensis]|uniref:GPO family capsid scaffolding protein n=1 Tax=Pseudomonas huanghezhanensis TaxID=3002903 RepID=UPI0022860A71|nr:GPO family capsid scaffolding protein [Pseudomonas sp. BSw22131]
MNRLFELFQVPIVAAIVTSRRAMYLMPRTLVSDWKRVATSGKTSDGRTIAPQDLHDMAEAYDPAIYTAVIWYEHIRYMGNFGSVTEVKAEDVDGGKVGLFARLQPNDRLLQLNKEAQKLFTSVEIEPNFADTGKPYLRGLAVTDEPASLGTEPLHFSRRATNGNHFGSLEPLGDLTPAEVSEASALSFLTRLFKSVAQDAPTIPLTPDPETSTMDPKTAEAFAAAVDKLGNVATRLETSAATFATQKTEPEKTELTPPEATTESVAGNAITVEQFNELKGSLDQLAENFNTALNKGKGQDVPNTIGAVTDEPEPVY